MKIPAFFSVLSASASLSHGAIIIGNLAAVNTTDTATVTNINYSPANPGGTPPTTEQWNSKALSFTMGSSAYTVTSLTLKLTGVSNGGADIPTVSIYLANGGKTAPSATLIGGFTNPTFSSTASTAYTFTPTSAFTLAAGSTYFITVQELNQIGADLNFVWDNGGASSITSTIPVGVGATNGVATFGGGPGVTAISAASSRFNFYQLDGTAVPEPSAITLLGLGLVSFGLRRRR